MTEEKAKNWHEWAEDVRKHLADHRERLKILENQLSILERKVRPLHSFWMKRQILITLRNEGKPRSWDWLWSRLGCDAWEPLKELEHEGMVVVTRSGSHTMYAAKETEETRPTVKSLGDLEPLAKIVAGKD